MFLCECTHIIEIGRQEVGTKGTRQIRTNKFEYVK